MHSVRPESSGVQIQGYDIQSLIGEGGFGEVYRCREIEGLKRTVAIKVIRLGMGTREILARFDAEMNALAKMNHPTICRVIDSGITEKEQPYFAMEFIEGQTLDQWLKEENPNFETRLDIFEQLCQGISHAHERGVIHRDLKPGNVMITSSDEGLVVKIIDFGLAKALHDPLTDRTLITGQHYTLGTWNYMSPEQAKSQGSDVDIRSDIYSMGVMLYQMVSGRLPHEGLSEQVETEIIRILEEEMPRRPSQIQIQSDMAASDLPMAKALTELDWIILKAIESDPARRYSTVREFQSDLQRYRKGDEAVLACPPGALYLSQKFFQRNKLLVSIVSMVIFSLSIGIGWALFERHNAQTKTEEVLRLSALQDHDDLIAELDLLWPAQPHLIPQYERWIEDAEVLIAELPEHRQTLQSIRDTALEKSIPLQDLGAQHSSDSFIDLFIQLEDMKKQLEELNSAEGNDAQRKKTQQAIQQIQSKIDLNSTWTFPENLPENRWWNRQVGLLVERLEELKRNYLPANRVSPGHGWTVKKRLEFAKFIRDQYALNGSLRKRWEAVLPQLNSTHSDLNLIQPGLVPLGKDPESGLWEFWHIASGSEPQRSQQGHIVASPDCGIVFILIPGGKFWMGSQGKDPNQPNYESTMRMGGESPVHEVELSPFFISKFELTQGQWYRLTGVEPSRHRKEQDRHHYPVDSVDWNRGRKILLQFSMDFPSEAQWEYSARAGSSGPWDGADTLEEFVDKKLANVNDLTAKESGQTWPGSTEAPEYRDGFTYPSPVGHFPANRFGLHDVHGNLLERCLDRRDWGYYSKSPVKDPVNLIGGMTISRGGSFVHGPSSARSAKRRSDMRDTKTDYHGIRPIWKLVSNSADNIKPMAIPMKPATSKE